MNKQPVKRKKRKRKVVTYTHRDSMGIRWRYVGSRPVSELADRTMADCGLPIP